MKPTNHDMKRKADNMPQLEPLHKKKRHLSTPTRIQSKFGQDTTTLIAKVLLERFIHSSFRFDNNECMELKYFAIMYHVRVENLLLFDDIIKLNSLLIDGVKSALNRDDSVFDHPTKGICLRIKYVYNNYDDDNGFVDDDDGNGGFQEPTICNSNISNINIDNGESYTCHSSQTTPTSIKSRIHNSDVNNNCNTITCDGRKQDVRLQDSDKSKNNNNSNQNKTIEQSSTVRDHIDYNYNSNDETRTKYEEFKLDISGVLDLPYFTNDANNDDCSNDYDQDSDKDCQPGENGYRSQTEQDFDIEAQNGMYQNENENQICTDQVFDFDDIDQDIFDKIANMEANTDINTNINSSINTTVANVVCRNASWSDHDT